MGAFTRGGGCVQVLGGAKGRKAEEGSKGTEGVAVVSSMQKV